MASGKLRKKNAFKYIAVKALRQRSGDSAAIDTAAVWDNEDFSFSDVSWAELEGRDDLQQLAHHLPAFEGLTWDQLEVRAHLCTLGWTERAWDSAATVTR